MSYLVSVMEVKTGKEAFNGFFKDSQALQFKKDYPECVNEKWER